MQEQLKLSSKHLQFCVHFQCLRKCQHFRTSQIDTASIRKEDSRDATLHSSFQSWVRPEPPGELENKVVSHPPWESLLIDLGKDSLHWKAFKTVK